MRNDIKAMLKAAADRQEINNIQDRILNCVDTSKVVRPIEMPKRRSFRFLGYTIAGVATAALLITFGITYGVNTGKGEAPYYEPHQQDLPNPEEPAVTEQKDYDTFVKEEIGEELAISYNSIMARDAYNMISAANTFKNYSFNDYSSVIEPLSADLEGKIVSDVSPFVHNLEDMFGLVEKTTCVSSKNTNPNYTFDNVIEVDSPYYSYDIYYNEILREESNLNRDNYKYKAELAGVIAGDDYSYLFYGIRRIKNGRMEYETNIFVSNSRNITIKEVFSTKNYEFTYIYNNGTKSNKVNIQQKFDENKLTKEVDFSLLDTDNNKLGFTFKHSDKYYLYSKVKSADTELYISKVEDTYNFKFKKSGNEYTNNL